MAITNLGTLNTAIADWSVRSSFTSFLPDFIRIVEDICNYGEGDRDTPGYIAPLRCLQMETSSDLTIDADYQATLPTDFLETRRVRSTSPVQTMIYVTPEWYSDAYPSGDQSDFRFYTVLGANLISGQDATLDYYQKIPTLVGAAADATNWLLTASPFTYLWGSLYALSIFNKAAEASGTFRNLFLASTGGFRGTTAFQRADRPTMRASMTAF